MNDGDASSGSEHSQRRMAPRSRHFLECSLFRLEPESSKSRDRQLSRQSGHMRQLRYAYRPPDGRDARTCVAFRALVGCRDHAAQLDRCKSGTRGKSLPNP